MCGIIGYIGKKQASQVLLDGLKQLEYRGYDSAGIATLSDKTGNITLSKKKGGVENLRVSVKKKDHSGHVGIAHTRWATHGAPTDKNAHPHTDEQGTLALVHNGIIENAERLREELRKKKHTFKSETDSEVLVHLIEEKLKRKNISLSEAVRLALGEVIGAYGIAVLSKERPGEIVVAKKGSPLAIGIADDEIFLASDATPLVVYTKKVIYLEDGEIATLTNRGHIDITTLRKKKKKPKIQTLEMSPADIGKGGYESFTLKEIFSQPETIRDSLRGRVSAKDGWTKLGGVEEYEKLLLEANHFSFLGCGTSWHSGIIGAYLLEDLARIKARSEYASEFRYKNPAIGTNNVFLAISQSGETADTLQAIRQAKSANALTLGLTNVVGSSIARLTDAGSYTHAGPEIGVASTKAFTAQVAVLAVLALRLAQEKGTLSKSRERKLLRELEQAPRKVEKALKKESKIKQIAKRYKNAKSVLFLGRGINFPVALEGALKLKEISYIHAEGYPSGEMKHGPIALIEKNTPSIVIATKGKTYEKTLANIAEIKARGGPVIAICTEGDERVKKLADESIEVPKIEELLSPLVNVIPLQLFAYHIASALGKNIDKPRNLAKSVTVE